MEAKASAVPTRFAFALGVDCASCTSIRQPAEGRRHRFSWINEWQERTDRNGKPAGIELIVPDWF